MPRSRRALVALPLAAVLAFGTVGALSGCSLQGVVRDISHGHVDVARKTVPADFPTEVPLADGEVLYGATVGSSDGKLWNVTIRVHDPNALATIEDQLADAGFTRDQHDTAAKAGSAAYTKKPYSVLVVVARDGAREHVANYTVTEKK
ncbi:hypothetical protein [Humibacter ginsenosidimutans]|uniref:Uncharacterized protein n=1 Tax=Humibacter ginsenosidimutans TaxID=2599293 RepID=A0A5B8M0M7_9MICO|nr:hypothetical protein [Humibacter ginsenosidimutans]QDZ14378.1 hypothetical protein FPZ11_06025 [Humibacter ginsenosidimutans]